MRHSSRLVLNLILTLLLAAALPACGGDEAATSKVKQAGRLEAAGITLPAQILGLQVQVEDVSKELAGAKRSYLTSLGLYSLRENDLIRATLQVSRFNQYAEPEKPSFRQSIIARLGTRKAEIINVSGQSVYTTTGTDQAIFAWFEGKGFFVLTTHRDFEFPRTLLRRVIETKKSV